MEIEKNIPIPTESKSRSAISRTLTEMQVGDSVFLTSNDKVNTWRSTANYQGKKVSVRKENDGHRFWIVGLKER